jgi:hypothetical protein
LSSAWRWPVTASAEIEYMALITAEEHTSLIDNGARDRLLGGDVSSMVLLRMWTGSKGSGEQNGR